MSSIVWQNFLFCIMIRSSAQIADKVKVLSIFRTNIVRSLTKSETAMVERPVENSIRRNLESALKPVFLDVINESYMHNVPKGSETHFKVVVVSKEFENMPLLGRHRLVNSLLESELKNGVHALSIVAKAPSQWDATEEVKPSPKCLGGFGK